MTHSYNRKFHIISKTGYDNYGSLKPVQKDKDKESLIFFISIIFHIS